MYWLFVCNQSDCIGLYVYPVFLEQMPDGLLEIALAAFEVSPDFLWRRCIGYVHRTTVGTHVFHKAFGKICRSAFCLSAEQKVDFAVAANGFHSCLVMLADVYLGKHLVVVNHAPMQIIDNYPISQVGALGYQHIHQLVGTIVWYCVVDKIGRASCRERV